MHGNELMSDNLRHQCGADYQTALPFIEYKPHIISLIIVEWKLRWVASVAFAGQQITIYLAIYFSSQYLFLVCQYCTKQVLRIWFQTKRYPVRDVDETQHRFLISFSSPNNRSHHFLLSNSDSLAISRICMGYRQLGNNVWGIKYFMTYHNLLDYGAR